MSEYGKLLHKGDGASLICVVRSGTPQMLIELPCKTEYGEIVVIRGAEHAENNGSFPVLDVTEAGVYLNNPKCKYSDYATSWEVHEEKPDGEPKMEEKIRVNMEGTVDASIGKAAPKEKRPIVRGSVVRLISGGPFMTVKEAGTERATCVWFVHHEADRLQQESFHPDLLEHREG